MKLKNSYPKIFKLAAIGAVLAVIIVGVVAYTFYLKSFGRKAIPRKLVTCPGFLKVYRNDYEYWSSVSDADKFYSLEEYVRKVGNKSILTKFLPKYIPKGYRLKLIAGFPKSGKYFWGGYYSVAFIYWNEDRGTEIYINIRYFSKGDPTLKKANMTLEGYPAFVKEIGAYDLCLEEPKPAVVVLFRTDIGVRISVYGSIIDEKLRYESKLGHVSIDKLREIMPIEELIKIACNIKPAF